MDEKSASNLNPARVYFIACLRWDPKRGSHIQTIHEDLSFIENNRERKETRATILLLAQAIAETQRCQGRIACCLNSLDQTDWCYFDTCELTENLRIDQKVLRGYHQDLPTQDLPSPNYPDCDVYPRLGFVCVTSGAYLPVMAFTLLDHVRNAKLARDLSRLNRQRFNHQDHDQDQDQDHEEDIFWANFWKETFLNPAQGKTSKWLKVEKSLAPIRFHCFGNVRGILPHNFRIETLLQNKKILNQVACRFLLIL